MLINFEIGVGIVPSLIKWFGNHYTHVRIIDSDLNAVHECSMCLGEVVCHPYGKHIRDGSPFASYQLILTDNELATIRSTLYKEIGKKFSVFEVVRVALAPWTKSYTRSKYYCASLIASALMDAGLFPESKMSHVTPDLILDHLTHINRVRFHKSGIA